MRTLQQIQDGVAEPEEIREVSARDRRRLGLAFEKTPTFFQLLSTARTRRVGMGYRLEDRAAEPAPPLAFVSNKKPQPLCELELALLCWAACGPNGIVTGDIPTGNDLGNLMGFAGRTIPSASNDWCVDLLFTNDDGVFLYRPEKTRNKVVEIEGPEDYSKVLDWFRRGVVRISKSRLDVDWNISPGRPMGVWQYNLNRPGSTWFLPVADVARGMVNLYYSVFEHMQWLITDEETGEPCGLSAWARPGRLELPITQRTFEEVMLHMADYQHGMLVQNLRLASEALGLGCWIFGGFCQDIVLGGFRPLAKGLRFRYRAVDGRRNYTGIPKLLEGYGMPAPWNKSVKGLIERFWEEKAACFQEVPYEADTAREVELELKKPKPAWVNEAVEAVLSYSLEKFGRFPVHFSAYHSNLHAQVHHLDPDFYDEKLKPGYLTQNHRDHEKNWHD